MSTPEQSVEVEETEQQFDTAVEADVEVDNEAEAVEAEKSIYIKQLEGEGKPAEMLDKIATGKLNKWYSEQALVEQTWIFGKDRVGKDVTIEQYAKMTADKAGAPVRVRRFNPAECRLR